MELGTTPPDEYSGDAEAWACSLAPTVLPLGRSWVKYCEKDPKEARLDRLSGLSQQFKSATGAEPAKKQDQPSDQN